MPILTPPPLLHLPVLPDLIVRAIVPALQLAVMPPHIVRHVRFQIPMLINVGRLPAVGEGRVGLIGGDLRGGLWRLGGAGGNSGLVGGFLRRGG